jgi:hypothetical protein
MLCYAEPVVLNHGVFPAPVVVKHGVLFCAIVFESLRAMLSQWF